MTESASEAGRERELPADEPRPRKDDRSLLTYEGSRIPMFVVLVWIVFFVWGLVYLVRWIPESWQEWISR